MKFGIESFGHIKINNGRLRVINASVAVDLDDDDVAELITQIPLLEDISEEETANLVIPAANVVVAGEEATVTVTLSDVHKMLRKIIRKALKDVARTQVSQAKPMPTTEE